MIVNGLDLRHLEIFAAVVQHGGMTQAAKSLGLTQPTVSGHIRSIESEAGTMLLHRGGGRARPTAAGAVLYEYARQICDQKTKALVALESFLGLRAGELKIGASTTPATYFLPAYLCRFKEKHPAVHVELTTGDTRTILEALDDGKVEIALVGDDVDAERYHARRVATDRIVLVVGRAHPWFGRKQIKLIDLKGQPIVVRGDGSATLSSVDHALSAAGLEIGRDVPIALRLPTNESIREAVAGARTAAFLPRACLVGRENELAAIEIEGLPIERAFTAVLSLSREPGPAAKALLEMFGAKPPQPSGKRG